MLDTVWLLLLLLLLLLCSPIYWWLNTLFVDTRRPCFVVLLVDKFSCYVCNI
jgi:hypothetical protein